MAKDSKLSELQVNWSGAERARRRLLAWEKQSMLLRTLGLASQCNESKNEPLRITRKSPV